MNRAAPEPKANMGRPEPRIDGRLKVTGEARYGSDFAVSNPAYAFLITSTISKGRINQIDQREARAVPGVLEIFTHENVKGLNEVKFSTGGGGETTSWQDLGPEIGHDGQIIGMVVADTYEAAQEAASLVKASYSEEKPSATFGSSGVSMQNAADASERAKKLPQAGDADTALKSADVAVDAQYSTPTQHHNPIELFTTTCVWRDGELTVYEPSQFVYGLKNTLAQ
jgi:xanthine dehydrogenase YagR molybdenum-binding subunit